MISVSIPGGSEYTLRRMLLDINGTICRDGVLLPGVKERLCELRERLAITLLSSDTFGTAAQLAEELGLDLFKVNPESGGQDKLDYLLAGDPETTVAVGNGANDALMLQKAALSICVLGEEGTAVTALLNSDVAVREINDAFDLLLSPRRLIATLRP